MLLDDIEAPSPFPQPLKSTLISAFQMVSRAAERGERFTGKPTGIFPLDELTGGLHGGTVTVVVGPRGAGKTALALQIASNVASPSVRPDDEPIAREHASGALYFSSQGSPESLVFRLVCAKARVAIGLFRSGVLSQENWQKLAEAATFLSKRVPIWLHHAPELTVDALEKKVHWVRSQVTGPDHVRIIVVDTLESLIPVTGDEPSSSDVATATKALKLLAQKIGCPIVATSTRYDWLPAHPRERARMRALRPLETHADAVIVATRPEPNNLEKPTQRMILSAEMQRNGPTGDVAVAFDVRYLTIEDAAVGGA